jgi:hypothetical protein
MKNDEMGRICMKGNLYAIDGKSRREETTRKTKM